MALIKLKDFDPDYQNAFQGDDIHNMSVYAEGSDEKIGSVSDVLVDENGNFRYLVVDLGFWIFGKKILLPVGRSRIDYNAQRVYALGLSRQEAESLPEYQDRMATDYDYEEQVRGVYRNSASYAPYREATVEGDIYADSQPVDARAVEAPYIQGDLNTVAAPGVSRDDSYDRNTYSYDREPGLFGLNERDHQTFRLYQERLIANKTRQKTGEVAIGKHVETETATVSVPLEKERIIVERTTPTDTTAVTPGEVSFQEGEVARMEIYEEVPDIRKEAFVREEVNVKKVVEQETANAQETIRREELDIQPSDNIHIDRRNS